MVEVVKGIVDGGVLQYELVSVVLFDSLDYWNLSPFSAVVSMVGPLPLRLAWILAFLTCSSSTVGAFVVVSPPITCLPSFSRSVVARKMSEGEEAAPLPPLHPAETAFVLIEYQNEFCSPGGKLHDAVKPCMDQTKMLENSIATVQQARSAGCTIIHCPINFEPGHNEISKDPYGILAGVKEGSCFTAGEWGADFVEGMKPAPGDLVVKGKSGLCGFESTNLQFLLSQSGAKNVVLGGFLTNCCVESTMRSACEYRRCKHWNEYRTHGSLRQPHSLFFAFCFTMTADEKGYRVFTLKDCVAATSVEAQDATLKHNFGMFSVPTTSKAVLSAIQSPVTA